MTGYNWGGTLRYAARDVARPSDLDELRSILASARPVKPLGTRHSFSPVADAPDGVQVDLSGLASELVVDAERKQVTIGGGTTYGQVLPKLAEHGLTLPMLASLPHCTVAGSVATGTHGSGSRVQGLGSSVAAVDLMSADGQVRNFRRGDQDFPGVVVNLGALGVVVSLTLDCVPMFAVRQDVYEPLGWDALHENGSAILDLAYSVSIFTRWSGPHAGHVVLKSREDESAPPHEVFGATPADGPRHPVHQLGAPATGVTEQGGVLGPAGERLPHFRLGFTPSSGAEVQSEYFVARSDLGAAVRALHEVGDAFDEALLISEIRSVAADDLWLSAAFEQDVVGFHFTWRPDEAAVRKLTPVIERALAPFDPKPHWGKVFTLPGPQRSYPGLAAFAALRRKLDPDGVFDTPFVREVLG
ncbi:FAD-binding protein [Dermacoccaceae bacterium W4C1]